MTKEDKDLLLKDLCARLPYGVIGAVDHYDEDKKATPLLGEIKGINYYQQVLFFYLDDDDIGAYNEFDYTLCKPYLRPLSSMTEEEKVEFCDLQDKYLLSSYYPVTDGFALYDWLNTHHFDYRGLIDKGLAIEVMEENNPYKD